ncbi:MAG: peptidoglycan editing factor PgeF [Chloroflexi bacterium]|nr:peptidoglycan editing factor PgeF [Chloroflexota bacterium]MBI3341121.1 peptidoglycan editing factor PgeF [Chloroflexota bacterium]
MPFSHNNGIRYFSFDIFPRTLTQAVFTRQGGVSPAPWDSLNVGGTVGDEVERVLENRSRSFAALGRTLDSLFDVWQVHSADAVHADAPRPAHEDHHKADIILTDKPNVTLYMRFADCVPILFHDPKQGVVGITHAGWMGTVRGASAATVKAMCARYGSQPKDIQAAIGPSIGADHYEVGPDVVSQVDQAFGADAKRLIESRGGKTYLDLWAANRIQLQKSGVEQIEVAGLCTACHLDDWFSHRAEKGKTGRFGALIALA